MKIEDFKILATNDYNANRIKYEEKHLIRSEFERDRDRIMYSKAFRRLSGKTQVFLTGTDDHVRTRLTHTLEVVQIARTIAKALNLNEELTEAIALGHDIGHTPFGHVGERMLNNIMNGCYTIGDFNTLSDLNEKRGFKHNWQSVRVAVELEENLNLTDFTLWGMLNHSDLKYKECKMKGEHDNCLFRHEKNKVCNINLEDQKSLSFYWNRNIETKNLYDQIKGKWSFEGLIVELADEVAQRHHDIEDALEYRIIEENELLDELERIFNFDEYKKEIQNCNKDILGSIEEHKKNFKDVSGALEKESKDSYISKFSKFIVNILTTDIIFNTKLKFGQLISKYDIKGASDFHDKRDSIDDYALYVEYSDFISKKDKKLEEFLRDRILNSYKAQTMDGVGNHIIKGLFKAYLINPQQLPDKTIIKLFRNFYRDDNDKLKEYKNDKNGWNVGKFRNLLSEYHFGRVKGEYNRYKVVLVRTICDYVSGMTDKYAIEEHRKLYNIN